ncbi:hypothetical protein B0H12DRAFT_1231852 [Mycena haematopus]|nr:hypothetical protein B0H12DRAFT_1231852 [Mycena haematopus]
MSSEASEAQTIYFQNYSHIVPVCFLIYDQIITLDQEFNFVWKHPNRPSTYWFLALRYGALLTNIPVVVFSFTLIIASQSCVDYDFVHQLFMLVTELVVSALMIIRMYALYAKSACVLWGLLGIGICLIALTAWSMKVGQHGHSLTIVSGCHLSIVDSASIHLAIPWECLFVFDSMYGPSTYIVIDLALTLVPRIFGLTVYNGYMTHRAVGGANMPLHRLMVRDGAMYFAAMALANLANIVTFLIRGPLLPGSLATFATCTSVTLMTRLMLNINERTEDWGMSLNLSDELEFVVDDSLNQLDADFPLSSRRREHQV